MLCWRLIRCYPHENIVGWLPLRIHVIRRCIHTKCAVRSFDDVVTWCVQNWYPTGCPSSKRYTNHQRPQLIVLPFPGSLSGCCPQQWRAQFIPSQTCAVHSFDVVPWCAQNWNPTGCPSSKRYTNGPNSSSTPNMLYHHSLRSSPRCCPRSNGKPERATTALPLSHSQFSTSSRKGCTANRVALMYAV